MLKNIIIVGSIFLFLAILCLFLSKLIRNYSSYSNFQFRKMAIFCIVVGILMIIFTIAGS